jgi:cytoskeletal protein CcmA (bactofilin family)
MNNLSLMGHGTASGGVYDRVRINGDATITGDLECREIVCNGRVKVTGNVKAKLIRINGEGSLEGRVEAGKIKVYGQTTIGNDAQIKNASIYGEVKIKGRATFDEIHLKGGLQVAGDCEAEEFKVHGAFTIQGLLNVGTADIVPYGDCKAPEIGGEKITVRKANRPFGIIKWFKLFTQYEAEVVTDMMEGDDLELETANIKVVRGNRVKLGKSTAIQLVEYRDHFEKHEQAEVKETVKITA